MRGIACQGLVLLLLAAAAGAQTETSTTATVQDSRAPAPTGGIVAAAVEPDTKPDSKPKAKPSPAAEQARDLLERSYSIGETLPPSERAKVLPRQILAATSIHPELAVKWAEDALQFAQELPAGADRAAIYANAIPALVDKDPARALEVFHSLPPEEAFTAGSSDPVFAAFNTPVRRLFSRIVQEKGEEGVELIRQEAQRLAQTTYYPYSAVLAAIRELKTDDKAVRENLFADALAAYRQGNRSLASDSEFARMLVTEWSGVPRTLAREAFNAVATNLLARAEEEDQQASSTTMSPPAGSTQVRGSADRVLLRLMPLIRIVDPELQQKIQQARPDIARAMQATGGRGIQRFASDRPGGGASPPFAQQQQLLQSFAQYNQARRNPSQALTASQALTDPLARTLTLVGAAAGMARRDRAAADSILEEAARTAERIQDPAQQLEAAAMIADAAGQLESKALLRSALERGFNAAEILEESGSEPDPRGRFTLQRLVRTGFQQDPQLALAFIDRVRIPQMKAGLLVDAAQATFRPQRGRGQFPGEGGGFGVGTGMGVGVSGDSGIGTGVGIGRGGGAGTTRRAGAPAAPPANNAPNQENQ